MIEAILFILLAGVVIFAGFMFSKRILGENRVFALVPLSVILGFNGYNFLVNITSNFIPIKIAVWVSILFLLIFSLLSFFYKRINFIQPDFIILTVKQQRILFGTAILISLFSGLVAVKSLALDDLFVGHLPLAKTITEGNFPVVDPTAPEHKLSYHYGADLLTAIFNMVADVPLWLGYDIQMFFFSGALFLMLFLLAYEITKNYWASFVASFLFLYSTGLQWLYFFTEGIPVLWARYINGVESDAPWRFLTDIAFPKLNTSYIHSMHNHSTAMGTPILMVALWLYIRSMSETDNKKSIIYIITASICYGYVALSLETYFIISTLALITLLIIGVIDRYYSLLGDIFSIVRYKLFFRNTLFFIFIGFSLAVVQGGVIASLLKDSDREKVILVKDFNDFMNLDLAPKVAPKIDYILAKEVTSPAVSGTIIRLFDFDFFVQFGLPILLIFPAIFYFLKKRKGEVLMFVIMGLGAFIVPFIFRWPSRNWEMSRFFLIAIPIFSFVIGMFLVQWFQKSVLISKRILISGFIVLMCVTGVMSQSIFMVSNLDRFGKIGPLFMSPPKPFEIDASLYDWVNKNTTLNDRFFPYSENFIRHTGRYTPGAPHHFTFSQRNTEREWYIKIISECSIDAVRFFSINYFYVKSNFPIKNIEQCLKKLEAEKVYEIFIGNEYNKVYRIKLP